jgi:hypothetical protein
MKLFVSLAALWLIVWRCPAFAAAPATQPDAEKSVAELKAKVEKLEAEVKELRAKLAERDKLIDKYVRSAKPLPPKWDDLKALNDLSLKLRVPPAPSATSPSGTIPPGSVPRQFNGATYYLIPLGEEERGGSLIDDRAHRGYAIPPDTSGTRPTTR